MLNLTKLSFFETPCMYIMNIVFIFKNLGDGGLMSQGRAAELPVTTDTNVPLTPATLFFIFFHYLIIYYYRDS